MLNADGNVWLERLGEPMKPIGKLRQAQAQGIIETTAGVHNKEITRYQPTFEGEFPLDGSRFAAQLPPVVPAPTFAIRKKAISIFTLDQYVENGVMTEEQKQAIQQAVRNHKNILVIGGTGSGKTTLVNAIIHEMVVNDPSERIFIIEDTGEIQCSAKNHVQYHTSLEVDMTALLKTTLRMRPDRILVSARLASDHHSCDCDSNLADRHVCRDAVFGRDVEHAVVVWPGAGDWDCRRRRDCGG